MKKIFVLIGCLMMIGGIFVSPVFASAPIAKPFKISLHTSTQDPKSKEFRIIAKVNSITHNDRVTITWSLPTNLKPVDEETLKQNVRINVGDNYYSILVKPQNEVDGYVNFTIESFASTNRVLYNQRGMVVINSNLILEPENESFKTLESYYGYLDFFKFTSIIFLSIGFIFLLIKYLYDKFVPVEHVPQTPRNSKILMELERRRLEENIPISPTI